MHKIKKFHKKYLIHLGCKKTNYISQILPCEICNSKKTEIIQKYVHIGNNKFGYLPFVICLKCGLLYQKPKLSKRFYTQFYAKWYRNSISHCSQPSEYFFTDQRSRAKKLIKAWGKYFKSAKNVLDVGCSSGGMLYEFRKKNFKVYGVDPDRRFVMWGKKKYKLPISVQCAENFKSTIKYDLILIMGSLEHVYNANTVLKHITRHASKTSFLVLEGRGYPQKSPKIFFSHNHHRIFTRKTMQLLCIKHGWFPLKTTTSPICGPTRPGAIYGIFQNEKKDQSTEKAAKKLYLSKDTKKSILKMFTSTKIK